MGTVRVCAMSPLLCTSCFALSDLSKQSGQRCRCEEQIPVNLGMLVGFATSDLFLVIGSPSSYAKNMKKRSLVVATLVITGQLAFVSLSHAACETTSRTDTFGKTTTTGTCSGKKVSTTSKTDSFGKTTTSGTVGKDKVSTTSKTDSFGKTTTSGTVGKDKVSTTSKSNGFGTTNTTGKIGSATVKCTTRTDSFGKTTQSCK
jgi:hypothetical protein